MHHLGDNAYAAKARKELTEKLIAQDAQHRSRYRVDWWTSVIWDCIKVAAAFVITVCPALYGLWRWKQSVLRADGDGHHAIVVQAAQWLDGLEKSIIMLTPSGRKAEEARKLAEEEEAARKRKEEEAAREEEEAARRRKEAEAALEEELAARKRADEAARKDEEAARKLAMIGMLDSDDFY